MNFETVTIIQPPEEVDCNIKLSEQLSVNVDYLRRSDEKMVHAWYEEKNKGKEINIKQRQSDIASLMVAASIKEVITPNGVEEASFEDKVYLVENIPQSLFALISDWQTKYYFGPDLKINIKCPHCEFSATQEFESSDFFS